MDPATILTLINGASTLLQGLKFGTTATSAASNPVSQLLSGLSGAAAPVANYATTTTNMQDIKDAFTLAEAMLSKQEYDVPTLAATAIEILKGQLNINANYAQLTAAPTA